MKQNKAYSKAELARMAGVHPATFCRWLQLLEDDIPQPYNRSQRLLRPDQAHWLIERLCL